VERDYPDAVFGLAFPDGEEAVLPYFGNVIDPEPLYFAVPEAGAVNDQAQEIGKGIVPGGFEYAVYNVDVVAAADPRIFLPCAQGFDLGEDIFTDDAGHHQVSEDGTDAAGIAVNGLGFFPFLQEDVLEAGDDGGRYLREGADLFYPEIGDKNFFDEVAVDAAGFFAQGAVPLAVDGEVGGIFPVIGFQDGIEG
jgi:hypothetical protein